MNKFMRMIVFFDLPVTTAPERKAATKFRNFLIKDGYCMMQFSVYSRVCNGNDAVEKHSKRLKTNLPKNGSVRLLTITEKQYRNMAILLGEISVNEKPFQAEQLTIF
ncbi:MAG: CRISPR-associated endonuclease Cas2 [Oscillospiraceae bacterium]|nr:CRISPR-associated endonuclease Cas2 [Oscillospiraceae bacterium]